MDKIYSPENIEQHIYKFWESHGYFQPQGIGKGFCIVLPPPNVTGYLHMGHGFQHTLMDILIRYERMLGKSTLWQPGTDHAGIATQIVVEKQLETQGTKRKDLEREEFLDKVWQWKEKSGSTITAQMRRIGDSVDWSRERFTMDADLSLAVQKVFIQLYEEGLIYRGNRLVNWDPTLCTAISDLEVISEEVNGSLWYISYPINNNNEKLIVATTRPETMFGDTAVAVHPQDSRYQHLIGQEILLPLCERLIPIIADSTVDPNFGTGCVKITPAHDFNDYEIAKRHKLTLINILTPQALLNDNVPLAYQGLTTTQAREQVIKDLKVQEFLIKIEPHQLKIPRSEKSQAIIEPYLTNQWYVKTKILAKSAIDVVKDGEIRFFPDNWKKTYFHWLENIDDWCISRQLWWGHRIPAWYDEEGKIYVGYSENDVRFKHKLTDNIVLTQDEDVLDTWFSSSLWPFTSLGWPQRTEELQNFFPTAVLVTGFDIIFFWVARMIMMSLKFTGQVPFRDVIITGLIRDSEGQKMSKSKGNVLDPLDVIDGIDLDSLLAKRTESLLIDNVRKKIAQATKREFPQGIPSYGSDALRFTFCSLASQTRFIRFELGRVEGYRNFCNKIWNAARFILLNTDEDQGDFGDGAFQYSPADSWILSRLQNTIALTHQYITQYRFDLLANTLYDFVWHEYCDWYLELSKPVLYDENTLSAMKRGTRRTLVHVLDQILKLLHPIMPFITEEIWQRISKLTSQNGETIMLSPFPQVIEEFINQDLEIEFNWLKLVIQVLRTTRSEMGISPAHHVRLVIKHATAPIQKLILKYQDSLHTLCKLNKLEFVDANTKIPEAALSVVEGTEFLIPLAGLVDKKALLDRLNKEIKKIEGEILRAQNKLNNESFIQKAPQEVINKEQENLKGNRIALEKLQMQIEQILS